MESWARGEVDAGDDHTRELAEKLKLLAAVDPDLAREWVSELVGALNRATGGSFGRYLSPAARATLGLPEPPATADPIGSAATVRPHPFPPAAS